MYTQTCAVKEVAEYGDGGGGGCPDRVLPFRGCYARKTHQSVCLLCFACASVCQGLPLPFSFSLTLFGMFVAPVPRVAIAQSCVRQRFGTRNFAINIQNYGGGIANDGSVNMACVPNKSPETKIQGIWSYTYVQEKFLLQLLFEQKYWYCLR